MKATSDDLARAREKLHAHGIELTPRKEAGRSSAPSAPAAPAEPAAHKPPELSDVLQPPHPSLKDDVPESWTAPAIQQWMRTFDPASQDSAKKLKEAGTRYGLPLARVNKLTIKTLQHIVSIGAAIAC